MWAFRYLTLALVITGGSLAHPGKGSREKSERLLEHRDLAERQAKQLAANCIGSPGHQSLQARAAERRSATAQALREERGVAHSKHGRR